VRSGKGRLRVFKGMETVDIKVRVSSEVHEELRQVAKRLGVPMAKIVREGLEGRLKELQNKI
jgi:predicted DNA-binding protein